MADMKFRNGVVDDKENLLHDVIKGFKEGLFNDVTFVTADGVSISTNKFMLACRVPFFASMLFGGFAENSKTTSMPLLSCNSKVFKEILQFTCQGEVSLSAMDLPLLLDFLEACRFFGIEKLVSLITDHLKLLLDGDKIDLKDCVDAFAFVEDHKFTAASDLFLSYFDQKLSSFSYRKEFGNLTESLLKKVLQNEKSSCKEIIKFVAFNNWLKKNETFPESGRTEILNLFDLRKFDASDLIKIVRRSKVFNEEEMFDVLEEKIESLVQDAQENETLQAVRFELDCGVDGRSLQYNTRAEFEIPVAHWINKLEFSFESRTSFSLECSQDGSVWTEICQSVPSRSQNIMFERRKMKFLGLKLSNSYWPLSNRLQGLTASLV